MMQYSRNALLMLSLASAAVYVSLTLIIVHYAHDDGIASLFDHGFPLAGQLVSGFLFGILAAGFVAFVMFRTPIARILRDYTIVDMLAGMKFRRFDRAQVSFFAGVGEELLFRGALQPVIGLWLTSLLFVALHGYFKFTSIRHVLFGVMMFGLSVGLGLLFEWAGLIAAMTAHAVYDYIMLIIGEKYAFWGTEQSGTYEQSDSPGHSESTGQSEKPG